MALESRSSRVLRFGTFEVDLRAAELRKQGVRIKLQEQPFHVLTLLLQRPGEVITREELRSERITHALITDLAQIGSVKVISRTSIMRYKKTDKSLPEIARELNVRGIIEGTVQRSGDRVRITAQLIEGATDKHLWAQSYERDVKDVLALQDELARSIAGEIKARMTRQVQVRSGASHPVNPKAYEAYLRGLAYSKQPCDECEGISLEYFNSAIQIDPKWAH